MRIYELNPILDGDILGSQVLALDDSTQTRKISLDQIRVFLGVGENSTLIPSGTDIYTYFLTAISGSYYGEGLLNTAQGGAWAAFDWTTHDQGRGTLIETNNANEMAVHSLAAGIWTKKKIISESGGKIGAIDVTNSIKLLDSLGATRGRFVVDPLAGIKIINDVGSVTIWLRDESYVDFSNAIRMLGVDGLVHGRIAIDQSQGFRLINDVSGTAITVGDDGRVIIANFPGNIVLNADGSTALSDYRHFDARYMEAGEAFTKSESDARYQNTAAWGQNGWHRDTSTGIITQWGMTASTAGTQPITFPIAFPTACATITTAGWTNGAAGAFEASVSAKSTTGATLQANQAFNIMWEAKGY